jgi:hypothetical protein
MDNILIQLRSAVRDRPPVVLPVTLIVVMALVALIGNGVVGLSFRPSLLAVILPALLMLLIAGWLHARRADPRFCEGVVYLSLWLFWLPVGILLSYLTIIIGFPLRDRALAAADAAFGFHWIDMAAAVEQWPWLVSLLGVCYQSCQWQPMVTVLVIAMIGPRDRNSEFLLQILLGLLVTLVISTFVPAIGPAAAFGVHLPHEDIVQSLRSGRFQQLPYNGVLCFPSFHTIMAVLFTYAHRGIRPTFWIFVTLNLGMLASTPYRGDHYLVDILGGLSVAALVIIFTQNYGFVRRYASVAAAS